MKFIISIIAIFLLLAVSVRAAVVTIERPSTPSTVLGNPVGVDFNNDSIDDVVVRFTDYCALFGSQSSCAYGVTITFASNVELFGSIFEGQLIPSFLPEGSVLGPSTLSSNWNPTGSLTLDLIYRFGVPSSANDGYPAYARSLERMFIGYRIVEGEWYRYGWIDVQLTDPPEPPDLLQPRFPEFNGVYVADASQQSVMVFPVPEPSVMFLTLGGTMLMIVRRNRNTRDEQAGTCDAEEAL